MYTLNWFKPALIVTATMFAAAPIQAQPVTVLRGSPPPQQTASVDCTDPYYTQYCQAYDAWLNQYYGNSGAYDYPDYSYYNYGLPTGFGLGFRFHHATNFNGGFHGGGFHGGGFHGGGFHGGGFHGGGFHGGGFHGGGFHGGGHR